MTTLNTPFLLSEIVEKTFDRLTEKSITHNLKEFDSQDLLELHGLFGSVLKRALIVLDTSTIVHYKSVKHSRILVEITKRSGEIYRLLLDINYCPCLAFKYQVLIGRTQYTCKHILATKLSKILNKFTIKLIDSYRFTMLIQQMASD